MYHLLLILFQDDFEKGMEEKIALAVSHILLLFRHMKMRCYEAYLIFLLFYQILQTFVSRIYNRIVSIHWGIKDSIND